MNRRELSTQEFRRRDAATEESIHHSTGWRSRRVQRGDLDESSHHDERSFRRQRILEAKRRAIVGDRMDELRSRRRIRELADLHGDDREAQAMVEKAQQERASEEAEKLRQQEEAKRLRLEQEEADKQRRMQRDEEIQRQVQLAAEAEAAAAKTKRKRLRRVIRRRIIKRKLAESLKHPPEPAPVSPQGSQERRLQLEVDTEHHHAEPLDADLTDSESYVEVSVGSQYDSEDLPDDDSEEPLPEHLFHATRDWDTTDAVPPPPADSDMEEETVVDDEDGDNLPQHLTEEEEMEDFMEFIEDDEEVYEEETDRDGEDEVYDEEEVLGDEENIDEEVSLVEEVVQDDNDGESNLEEEVVYEDSQGNLVIEEVTEGDPVDEEEFFETIRAMNTDEELVEEEMVEHEEPDGLDEPENDYPSETEEEAFQREQDELLRLAALKQEEEEEELRWEEEELAREAEAQRLAEEEAKLFDPNYALNQMLQSRPSSRPPPVRRKKKVDEDNVLEHEIGYRPPSLIALVNKAKTELRPPPPEEHKKQFVPVVTDAASLGRVLRLNEKVIEANGQRSAAEVNTTKTDSSYAAWVARHANRGKNRRPVAVESRSNAQIMVNEAAAVGKMKSGRQDARDFAHLEIAERKIHIDDLGDAKHDGAKVFRTGHLIDRHVEDKLDRNDWTPDYDHESYSNLDDVALPSDVLPVFKKHAARKSGMNVREELSREVAEGYWNRYYRLERPGANLVVTPGCFCKYCKSPNAWQTYAYQKKWAEERLPHEDPVEGHEPESLGYIARLYLQDPDQPDEIEFDDLPDEDGEQKKAIGGLATDGTSSVDFSLTSLDLVDESDDDFSLGGKLGTEGKTTQASVSEEAIKKTIQVNNDQLNHKDYCEDIPASQPAEPGGPDATDVACDDAIKVVQSVPPIRGHAAMVSAPTGIQHVDNVDSLLDRAGFHPDATSDTPVETDVGGVVDSEKDVQSRHGGTAKSQLFFSTEGHMELASIPDERQRTDPSSGAMSPRSARKQRRFRPLKWIKKTFGGSQKQLKVEKASPEKIKHSDGVTNGMKSLEASSDAVALESTLSRENSEVPRETCPVDGSSHVASAMQDVTSDCKDTTGDVLVLTDHSPNNNIDSNIRTLSEVGPLEATPPSELDTHIHQGAVAAPTPFQEVEQTYVQCQQILGNPPCDVPDVKEEYMEETVETKLVENSNNLLASPLGSKFVFEQGDLPIGCVSGADASGIPDSGNAVSTPSGKQGELEVRSSVSVHLDTNEDNSSPVSRDMHPLEAHDHQTVTGQPADYSPGDRMVNRAMDVSQESVGGVQPGSATKEAADCWESGDTYEKENLLGMFSSAETTEGDKCDTQADIGEQTFPNSRCEFIAEIQEGKQLQPQLEIEGSEVIPEFTAPSKVSISSSDVLDQHDRKHATQESDVAPESPRAVELPSGLDKFVPTEHSVSFASPGANAAQEVVAESVVGSPAELRDQPSKTAAPFDSVPSPNRKESPTVLEEFLDLHNVPHISLQGSAESVSTLGDQTASRLSVHDPPQGGADGDSKSMPRVSRPKVSRMSIGDKYRTASPESMKTSPPKLGQSRPSSVVNRYNPVEKSSTDRHNSLTSSTSQRSAGDGASGSPSSFHARMKAYLDKSDPQHSGRSVNSEPRLQTPSRAPLRQSLLDSRHSVQESSIPSQKTSKQDTNDSTPVRSTPKRGSVLDRYKPSVSPPPEIGASRESPQDRIVRSSGNSIQSRMKAYLNSSSSVVSGVSTRSEPAIISPPRRSTGISSSQSVNEASTPSKPRMAVKRGSVLDRYKPFEATNAKVEFAATKTAPSGSTRSVNGISPLAKRYNPSSGSSPASSAPVDKRWASTSSSLNARMKA
eukprot:Nitzschia sp. Nitz4//scaffold180_size44305//13216//18853//NITZ4_007237-RA/size44305-processed-gene-0.20-mRNA-1//-1//CDS//3329539461//2270//frame0